MDSSRAERTCSDRVFGACVWGRETVGGMRTLSRFPLIHHAATAATSKQAITSASELLTTRSPMFATGSPRCEREPEATQSTQASKDAA